MIKILTLSALVVFSLVHGHCQNVSQPPAFEVASVTPCKPGTPEPPGEHAGMVQFTAPGGRFKAAATTIKFLLEWAYGLQESQHSSGPSWMGTDRYDIVGKAEGNPTDDQMKLMVQTLLADRFKLKLHREKKSLPAYVISLGTGAPKFVPSKEGETHFLRVTPQTGADQKIVTYRVALTRFTFEQLADTFARRLGRVVVNQTGLNGEFNFNMDLTPDDSRPSPMDPSLIMLAMREQLGLTLKAQQAQVDFLVIESAEKVAAGN